MKISGIFSENQLPTSKRQRGLEAIEVDDLRLTARHGGKQKNGERDRVTASLDAEGTRQAPMAMEVEYNNHSAIEEPAT